MTELSQNDIVQEFSQICRNFGWRFTASRFAVFQCVRDNKTHPVVDSVWEDVKKLLPNISRESVYRVLTDFANKGLIYVLERPDSIARYDSNPKPHGHFFCTQCGQIYDFFSDDIEVIVGSEARSIGNVERVDARVYGVCKHCLGNEQ